ncbi:MAG: lipo-like protein [Deltaproteobacteria bacterium]|uniref:YiiX/YebB-like N1pC/P60 family cysteine hydrolase n=1 Tax=Desulfobacula sp. TaxID=2593537 RepID=UPI0019C605FB|nr:lipo-like protein [Candidatus Desulfobacula maris]MBL6994382.1 lipo-like protein [Desulfobacula sp.]
MSFFNAIGKRLATYLSSPIETETQVATSNPSELASTLRRGDILLIEGNSRISSAIKYLTQSTWSHAALYIGDGPHPDQKDRNGPILVEANINEGVRTVPLSMYSHFHTRICRPVGLVDEDITAVVDYAIAQIGDTYDVKNILDLARYLVSSPPIPGHLKRRLLALGSGDPTKAICSSMIAQAFQSIGYPILPEKTLEVSSSSACKKCYREIRYIKHHSLFVPRDFDASPYFEIIKPTLSQGFTPYQAGWLKPPEPKKPQPG